VPDSDHPDRLLDGARLAELRLRAGLSQRALGRAAGVSGGVIRRLEGGGSERQLSLQRLALIAERLGVDAADLLIRRRALSPPEPDDVRVEALLALSGRHLYTEEIATTLGWDMLRARRALTALRRRLIGGVALRRTAAGWKLAAAESALSTAERTRLEQVALTRRGLTVRQLRLLDSILAGHVNRPWEQRASNADRVDLALLLRAGVAERELNGDVRVTATTAYSLGLQVNGPAERNMAA
jgi:transcriptional regulator with XRE-family HTH domain